MAIVGPGADADPNSPAVRTAEKFTMIEGEALAPWFDQYVCALRLTCRRLGPSERQKAAAAAAESAAQESRAPAEGEAPPARGGDAMDEN